jgi:hypothetical protein
MSRSISFHRKFHKNKSLESNKNQREKKTCKLFIYMKIIE